MKKISLPLFLLFITTILFAQERYFARSYTSRVLPKRDFEIALWHTSRFGHEGQYFHAMDQRLEFETGLGSNVQTAFFFNRFQENTEDSTGKIHHSTEIGFSNEWQWRFTKPASELGAAIFSEIGARRDELELETKLILDKSFGENHIAFNASYDLCFEAKKEEEENGPALKETPLELDLGYLHHFSASFGAGIEVVDHNQLAKGVWEHSALFAGPTINYRGSEWFLVINFLPQMANLHKTGIAPENKVLIEHEKAEARILIGFSF